MGGQNGCTEKIKCCVSKSVQNFLGMAFNLDVLENLFNFPFLVNDESGPENTVELGPKQRFLSIRPVFRCHLSVRIGQEWEIEV